jgi:hypothetical protein
MQTTFRKIGILINKDSALIDKYSASMAGEFFVLGQLFLRGYVASLTYGNAKKVDILAIGKSSMSFRLEVKTTRALEPKNTKLFGLNYEWSRMNVKNEKVVPNLFYCFVRLRGRDEMPLFFIADSVKVAEYLKSEHQRWLDSKPKTRGGSGTDRTFRIGLNNEAHGLKPSKSFGWEILPK